MSKKKTPFEYKWRFTLRATTANGGILKSHGYAISEQMGVAISALIFARSAGARMPKKGGERP